ncbi:UDP-N-acetylmuramoyl-L-alanine--D-glutamate ligase [Patescibacteria group bacterium]|nr:UDP-N-acetylmuramoyl-L-alanine--D-glutamate ligase [Patescibacteria group bacterium]MBU2219869.1 UDP-N-acetylmuramoyl-L-alanine--D-glutamate ligase [Patescibacteria group bacterium]MBU2265082.1 UDP-N-acetylmuramoyl-L-alanine--D-glutamate ligase [Patescibacteria group bacterium]
MELKDFKDKRVTVMGIGLHGGGVGVIKFLAEQGAKILATDLRQKEELQSSLDALKDIKNIEYVLGEHRLKDFIAVDMVIKNPGVPADSKYLAATREKNIPIESDIGIFLELCPAPIIGVTGTKGKSTTAALLAHVLSRHYPQVILAGNIRQSVLEKIPEITKDTIVVLELSSWQLADAKNHKKSPHVAVLTNIKQDHLNRYSSFQDYVEDKKLIYKFQKDKDYLFLNYNDDLSRELAKEITSRIYFYSAQGTELLHAELPSLNQKARLGAYAKDKNIYYGASQELIAPVRNIKLIGQHNLSNALAAVSVADLYNVPPDKIKVALREFKGLEGRLQFIDKIKGVKYINDTTATAPDAAIAAIETINQEYPQKDKQKHLVLIAGGADKNLDFIELGKAISNHAKAVIFLSGTATAKIAKEIDPGIKVVKAKSMAQAVSLASGLTETEDIVLLSPGCASFGLFQHEFDRGKQFNEAVASLKLKM